MSKHYFDTDTEKAIHEYLISSGLTRQEIYNSCLHPAFTIMTESIIRRYFFGVDDPELFEELRHGAITHLISRLNKLDHTRHKAFSYCQTIVKNYCNDFFKFKKRRIDTYHVLDHCTLIELYDHSEVDHESSINLIFDFIDQINTGTTLISIPFVSELKLIKHKCITAGSSQYDVTKITSFYKKVFKDKVQGWREMNVLKDEFRTFKNKRLK